MNLPTNKKRILIADDESSLRTLLKAVMFSEGDIFEIIEAKDGDEAFIKIQDQKPDLAILDVMMPGQTGFELCESIKRDSALQGIKVVILTAKGKDSDKDWASSVGADCFLSKPFSPTELIAVCKKLLA